MANSLLTLNEITREAIRLWKNSNAFLMNVDTQYDDSFAVSGAKIGTSLRIRLPNDYIVRNGAAAQPQDTQEQNTTLVVATQKGVDVNFSSAERALSLDDYSRRVMAPAINNLTGSVAADLMSGSKAGICNAVANFDISNNILNPVARTFLDAGATLDTRSAPRNDRKIMNDPYTEARVISSLAGLFNPSPQISEQYRSAQMKEALNFQWFMDQTVVKQTTGSFTTGTVNGANQTGLTLVINAAGGTLNVGDIVQITNVNAVNRITKESTGQPMQFVVTAPVLAGATSIQLYPAIVPPVGGQPVQFQTVTASPANGATITPYFNANVTYRRNFAYLPEACTMATADLELPRGVHEAARDNFDGISMRMVTAYDVKSDALITRLDILYGYLWVRPEWAVIVADAL